MSCFSILCYLSVPKYYIRVLLRCPFYAYTTFALLTSQNMNVDLERGTVNNYGGTPNVFSLEFQSKYLHAIQVGTMLTTDDKVLRITTHPTELLDSLLYVAQAERIE